jgi:hypothetical protein
VVENDGPVSKVGVKLSRLELAETHLTGDRA